MDSKPKDISPDVRELLKKHKSKPAVFLGNENISKFAVFIDGMNMYRLFFDKDSERVFIPEGFNEYAASRYGICQTPLNSFGLVQKDESDESAALFKWFDLLDEYLISLGYEPLGKREDILEELRNRAVE